jgi:SAM-dependent methyltransferase
MTAMSSPAADMTLTSTDDERRSACRQRPGEPLLSTGFYDVCRSGWFNDATGELFTGFPLGPGDTYLDVGCGAGGAATFAARQGCQVVATDLLPDVVESLDTRLREAGSVSHRCLVSDSAPLPVPSGWANRIVCCEVMEHVPDPAAFIHELCRVGAAGARYLLTVPDPASEAVQRAIAPPSYWNPPNHLRVFSHEDFGRLVTDAGLLIEKRHVMGFFSAVWWSLFWAAGQELGQPEKPLLAAWSDVWGRLLSCPDGDRVKIALDRCMPKSQIIVARKVSS